MLRRQMRDQAVRVLTATMSTLARRLAGLARACHPEPTVAVTAVAAGLALAVGHRGGDAALVTATIAASQLAVGWANDALDADRDQAVKRTDKPIATGQVSRRTVTVAAAVAAVATVLLATPFGPIPTAVATVGLISGLAYNWPLKRTVLSPLPYACSFAALPAFVVLALPATPPGWLVLAGALLGSGAHFANVLPDLAEDAVTGIRGAPHRLGELGAGRVAGGLLLAATAVLVFGRTQPPTPIGLAGLLLATVALPAGWYAGHRARRRGRRPTALFRAFLVVALVDVSLLVFGGSF